MGTTTMKGIWVLGIALLLMSGCASKPEEAPVASEPEVMDQPVETTPAPAPKPESMVKNGALYALDSNGDYVAVGNGKFYFDFDLAIVKREGHEALNRHAMYLTENADVRVRLEGHADERGTREYNLALGERRANAIRAYLTAQGASSYQIEVISYGEEKPEVDGHGESAWAMNRRVELIYR
jgi:peptidoglycan-associated lipoprotein